MTISNFISIRPFEKLKKRFTMESEHRVDYNQMMSYPSIVANRWLAVRLEIVGAFVVLFACLFAVLARETIQPAMVGLSISYALQISQTLSFLVRMTAEVETNIVAIERGLWLLKVFLVIKTSVQKASFLHFSRRVFRCEAGGGLENRGNGESQRASELSIVVILKRKLFIFPSS